MLSNLATSKDEWGGKGGATLAGHSSGASGTWRRGSTATRARPTTSRLSTQGSAHPSPLAVVSFAKSHYASGCLSMRSRSATLLGCGPDIPLMTSETANPRSVRGQRDLDSELGPDGMISSPSNHSPTFRTSLLGSSRCCGFWGAGLYPNVVAT